ncbi:hypothetical protein JD969_03685 [Planctomycetota bacterium]|nr:hypothetical protein JD969_17815 [Planctomycetota bacterium]QQE12580.1 hypothetical protein JD969_03685 [Planctomycetota bacterium]
MSERSRIILIVICVVMLFVGCLWSGWNLYNAKQETQLAHKDYQNAREMIQQIKKLQDQPKLVEAGDMAMSDLRIRLEKAAQKANLDSLSSVWSESTQRVNQSSYLMQRTRVAVDDASMKQMLEFLWHVEDSNPSLTVSGLRLSAKEGRKQQRDESWKSDLTMTNLIYSPDDAKQK